jgi:hypothetical protein
MKHEPSGAIRIIRLHTCPNGISPRDRGLREDDWDEPDADFTRLPVSDDELISSVVDDAQLTFMRNEDGQVDRLFCVRARNSSR